MRGEVNNNEEYIPWVTLRTFHDWWDQAMARARANEAAQAQTRGETGSSTAAAGQR